MPVFWGDLHGHSNLSDGRGTPEDYFAHARDAAKLDFCALTDQIDNVPGSRLGLMPDESWNRIKEVAKKAHEPGKFVTFLGQERTVPSWDGRTPGLACIYYKGDGGPLLLPKHPARDWLRPGAVNGEAEMEQLWQALKDVECLRVIPHSGSQRQGYTWSVAPLKYPFDLIEIYSKWGSSEEPGAPLPISDGAGRGSRPGGTVRDALKAGFRPGFIGGSDTHFGQPGSNVWENDWGNALRYERTGLTAVCAEERTRESIFAALKARRCYATTGERIQLVFTINGQPMGSVLAAPAALRIQVRAEGTREIKRIEVFRNGDVLRHKVGGRETLEVLFDEPAPNAPAWFYARVTQLGEDVAWSSPIWVEPAKAAV